MMTKQQFIQKDFIWFIFINIIYSAPYFGTACIVFNIKQSLIIGNI